MTTENRFSRYMRSVFVALFAFMSIGTALAATANSLDQDVHKALSVLYDGSPAAKALGEKAKGILVFPEVTKAGLVVGGQSGNGALIKNGAVSGYYKTAAVSVGMQAGAQKFGFAIFIMSDKELMAFEKSSGWEIGVGPTVVVVDSGMGKDISTLTGKGDIFAFIFDQKGLMAGIGIQGSKITKVVNK